MITLQTQKIMETFEIQFKIYQDNKKKLLEQYNNKYIAMYDGEVLVSADTHREVMEYMKKKHNGLDDFIVPFVAEKDPVHIFSRVKL